MPKLSISIMAHPSRTEFFPYLQSKLGNVPMAVDYESKGEWWNCQRAWQLRDPKADWHVVIQDDAIICENFRERAEQTIDKAGEILKENFCVNFYYGNRKSARREAQLAAEKGYWINGYPKWGVAICLPAAMVDEMILFGQKPEFEIYGTKDDARIAKFCGSKKLKVYFPMPSLISHRHGPSLVGDPGQKRSAYKFIDD